MGTYDRELAQRFTPGQEVVWRYTPRGGYGYSRCVAARVIKVNPSGLVTIWAEGRMPDQWLKRVVRPQNLET